MVVSTLTTYVSIKATTHLLIKQFTRKSLQPDPDSSLDVSRSVDCSSSHPRRHRLWWPEI